MDILFYGNCQCDALRSVLNLDDTYIKHSIECFTTNIYENDFLDIIRKCNIIIIQPVSDNYRDKHYLSTTFIIENCKPDCKIILFNSCYFNFYYFNTSYKVINGVQLKTPHDYHYNDLITCYKLNLPLEKYFEYYVDNIYYKTSNDLELMANDSLYELNNRYEEMIVKYYNNNVFPVYINDYIRNNYKDKLLFYSMNHPSKYLLQFIAEQIVDHLKIINCINYNIDPLNNPKCILYKCIQNGVNFNIEDCKPITSSNDNNYDIAKYYYTSYKINNIIFD